MLVYVVYEKTGHIISKIRIVAVFSGKYNAELYIKNKGLNRILYIQTAEFNPIMDIVNSISDII